MVSGVVLAAVLALMPGIAAAQQLAFFSEATGSPSLFTGSFGGRPLAGEALESLQTASLFAGETGLFSKPLRRAPATPGHGSQIAQLRDLIASAEAGPAGYDAVQHRARVRPSRPPTALTLAEIFAWIERTPGQPHAIGRYQFIPSTLAYLVEGLGIPRHARFEPALQDRLADALLEQAGLADFLAGRMDRRAFMNAIAKIWAGLPNASGRSHYAGIAGNKAVLSWARFEAEMLRIFPASG
jgi:hypothetical protein